MDDKNMAMYKKQIDSHIHRSFDNVTDDNYQEAVESLTCAIERCWAAIEDLYEQIKTNAAVCQAKKD